MVDSVVAQVDSLRPQVAILAKAALLQSGDRAGQLAALVCIERWAGILSKHRHHMVGTSHYKQQPLPHQKINLAYATMHTACIYIYIYIYSHLASVSILPMLSWHNSVLFRS